MAILTPWLWAIFTVTAAATQTIRNALQRDLTARLGTVGATHVRFLFGLPFALAFLGVVAIAAGPLPRPGGTSLAWTALGAVAQIAATALMLAAMRERSFVVATAYTKTEPVQVALFALVFLGEHLSFLSTLAVLVATAGVLVTSWPKRGTAGGPWLRPAVLGIAAGGLFAVAAVGFRGGITALGASSFVPAATTTLAIGLALQTTLLTAWLLWRDRATFAAILRLWRPSLAAGFCGAVASQFWFLAFAIEAAARVRTLALVEVLFAFAVSHRLRQALGGREIVGIALIVAGVVLLLRG